MTTAIEGEVEPVMRQAFRMHALPGARLVELIHARLRQRVATDPTVEDDQDEAFNGDEAGADEKAEASGGASSQADAGDRLDDDDDDAAPARASTPAAPLHPAPFTGLDHGTPWNDDGA